MGYNAHYTLRILNPKSLILIYDENKKLILEKLLESDNASYLLDKDGNSEEPGSWYTEDEDMRKISKEYPNVVFELLIEGEESGDIWKRYYMDGKCQEEKAIIQFMPFDVNKLK